MWSVVLLIILSGSWVRARPIESEDEQPTFKMENLCNLYYSRKHVTQKNECHSCFDEVYHRYDEDDNESEDYMADIRECVLHLPLSFQICSRMEDHETMEDCLKEMARSFFKVKFQKFWKRWKDLLSERERGRVHQIFAFKSILKQIGNESSENLEAFITAFEPCLYHSSYNEDGRTLTYFDALDAAALEGTEDEDEGRSPKIERSVFNITSDNNVDGKDDNDDKPITPERQNDKVSIDIHENEDKDDLEKKKDKLNGYIGDAHKVFVCKIMKIKENKSLNSIMKNTLKTYDGVIPAELLRILYLE